MDTEATKAAARAERLKQLQMEDLGSARREYISTADKKMRQVSMQALEAARMSNVRGSEAQRTAEANKDKLAEWARDTEDLENLDTLLDGQTHRSQLNLTIRGSGGQPYTQEYGKGKAAVSKNSTHARNGTGVSAYKHHQRTGTSGRLQKTSPGFPENQKTCARLCRGGQFPGKFPGCGAHHLQSQVYTGYSDVWRNNLQ
ncbi:hypothetical protein P170DRAFT_421128 [Aspergillus steynii IBT 23096]|uniref:Uncharacterized protein n=1 Tax=Aspergillus steynii IBT 23096 TaxID=1392250 RepID=A0A2I2GNF4_9EURO|nr:uncharacterized protein P170DRAFT_421128 [Aspergillus steynii IBT 23096]PLB54415.1 hypothetical protein P170DRAFT_421128 [Aspergillus steynii IBT 23096]